ncbi:hypothetical protein NT6N_29290 [Oceaniferula spumae]|uniref:Ice-binding protein C-terminal domain-containing protein n=1 Tax=Oceaniferula spumae TaxID=2979115 RepID=A0AAT9FPP1_9BACT
MKFHIPILSLLAASSALAVTVVTENFNYADGSLAGFNGGSGWSGAWGATDSTTDPVSQFNIVSGEAIYTGYQGPTQEIVTQSRAFTDSYTIDVNTTLTLTFDIIVNETQLGRGVGISLTDSGAGSEVFIGKQINEGGSANGVHSSIAAGGLDHVVLSGSGSASLTAIFTSDGTDTFVSISDGVETLNGTIAGSQFTFDGLNADGYHRLTTTNGIDNISIDVEVVPEPSSIALLGFGGLALMLRRRK